MYKTLLAITNTKLLVELQTLDVWGSKSGFEIAAVSKHPEESLKYAENGSFDIVIAEIFENGFENFINELKKKGCPNVIALSEELTLEKARLCIINGASDYFVLPLSEKEFSGALERIRLGMLSYREDINVYEGELAALFSAHDAAFCTRAKEISDKLYSSFMDTETADRAVMELLKNLTDSIFEKNEWLDLYINKEDISSYNDTMAAAQFFLTSLSDFFEDFKELYPTVHNDKILKVILYILNNPESDLKQKNIAASLYMNSSYLSTVFTAHTEQRFVDYLTNVKLRRAAWLLRNTPLKVTDIAERLDYKDMGYFSRLFKKKYGITPSDYRIPDNYDYYI